MKRSSKFLIVASLVFGMCFYLLTNYYDRTRPESPDQSVQRVYEWNSHSHFVYLNAIENYSLFLMVGAAVGCFLMAFFIERKQRERMRLSGSNDTPTEADSGDRDEAKDRSAPRG